MKKEGDAPKHLVMSIVVVAASIFLLLYFPVISAVAKQDAAQTFSEHTQYQNPAINNKLTGEVILNSAQNKNPTLKTMLLLTGIALTIIVAITIFIKRKYNTYNIEYNH